MPSETPSRRNVTRLAFPAPCVLRSVFLLSSLVLVCPLACASNTRGQALATTREALSELDEFGALLVQAGLPPDALPTGRELSVEEARRLRVSFDLSPWTPQQYPPRLVASLLLRDVEARGEAVSRFDLGRRIQDFSPLLVLRRDGYLARALTGTPVQCVGPVQVKDGTGHADGYEVDGFYKPDETTGQLQRVDVVSPAAPAR
jgi:hypothetical protein